MEIKFALESGLGTPTDFGSRDGQADTNPKCKRGVGKRAATTLA